MWSAQTVREVSETFNANSIQIFERRWQIDSPRFVLVITHGAGEHSDYWTDVARAMAAFGATSMAADLPGHGRSGGAATMSIDGCVDALSHVVDRARRRYPTLPVVLLGHSMGGLVSARFAQSHRQKIDALILHAAPLVEMPQRDPSASSTEALTPDPVLQRRIAEDPYRLTEAPAPEKVVEALEELARGAESVRAAGPLSADLPLVWMHGEEDSSVPFEGARRAFAQVASNRAVFLGYSDRGHGGLLESHPEEMIHDLGAAIGFALGW